MLFDYASLTPGQEVSRETLVMDNETVASYVCAVRDDSFGTPIMQDDQGEKSYVPAMAIAAMRSGKHVGTYIQCFCNTDNTR